VHLISSVTLTNLKLRRTLFFKLKQKDILFNNYCSEHAHAMKCDFGNNIIMLQNQSLMDIYPHLPEYSIMADLIQARTKEKKQHRSPPVSY